LKIDSKIKSFLLNIPLTYFLITFNFKKKFTKPKDLLIFSEKRNAALKIHISSVNAYFFSLKIEKISKMLAISSCLTKSLVLHKALISNEIDSKIFIGVAKNLDELEAHAWIESNNHVVNDDVSKLKKFKIILESSL